MNVGVMDTIAENDNGGPEDSGREDGANDHDEEDEDSEMDIRPVGRKRGVRSAPKKCSEARAGRKAKKAAEDTFAAKRDQDMHLASLGHNYMRMKSRTWKWDDVEKRLVKAGVTTRKADDCGKKWDNLYQQFKRIHKFMGLSGKENFFTLTPAQRREKDFDFQMDERVYWEMEAMTKADHTVHPANLMDTGAVGGVQVGDSAAGRQESVPSEGGGEGQDDEAGSTRDSTFTGGSSGGAGKSKNVKQQTFEAIADVMDKQGQLMATTVDSASKRQCSVLTRQCDILEQEVDVHRQHYEKADQANLMMCNALPHTVVHMPQRNTTTRGRRESGGGEGGEGKRGRGHFRKSATKIVVDNNSDGDEEEVNVAVEGVQSQQAGGRLGFGRAGVPRALVVALKQAGGSAAIVAQVRTPEGGGLVINEGRSPRPVLPAGGVASSAARDTIILLAGAGRVGKKVTSPSPTREELTTQQAGGSGTGKAKSPLRGGEGGVTGMAPPNEHQPWATGSDGGGEERRVVDVRHEDDRGDGRRESDNDDDNRPSKRLKKHGPGDDMERRSILWVDSNAFWGQGPRKPLREAVTDCTDYFIAIVNGD
ncbi:hypothetical protein CBR_g12902 [Chara braunii]|uniref:Myb-like domain-containing protein n=1 Tax=Chara braunii TaxID=69332 RepID=A0A388KSZ4_CHABU|nr:hypothetical protein CBR_g12902 [Chara braunii]|eukprot:GBG73184.1 hypothetical protein CBR_g12902 [Chara braunii]